MTPRESARADRRLARTVVRRAARLLAAGTVLAVPALAWSAEADTAGGGAGEAMPAFFLQNLLALVMCLTVLVIACKRFRRE